MRLRCSHLVSLLLLASACAIAPERTYDEVPLEVPQQWSFASSDEFANEPWWEQLGGAELTALVAEALRYNRDLEAAAARVDAALAQGVMAGALRKPSLGLGYDVARSRQNFIGFPVAGQASSSEVFSNQFTNQGVSLDASWEIDLWGGLAAGERAALADVDAAQAEWRAARLSLAGQTVKAWLAVVEGRLQAQLANEVAENFRANTEFVRRRYRQGRADALDLRLLESDLASADANDRAAQEDLARRRRQLELLLGRYPSGAVEAQAELPAMPPAPPAGLPSELLLRRPDLVAAERRLAAADHRLYAARTELYPSISLTGSAGRRGEDFDQLFDPDFDIWSIAANALQPLYGGGRLRAGVELQDAQAREALAGYADRVLSAFGEVEGALVAEELLEGQEHHLSGAAAQAQAAWELSQDRYQGGVVDVVTVLTSQRRAAEARRAALSVRRARVDNRVELYLALGGDFDEAWAASHEGEEAVADTNPSDGASTTGESIVKLPEHVRLDTDAAREKGPKNP